MLHGQMKLVWKQYPRVMYFLKNVLFLDAWRHIVVKMLELRKEAGLVKMFPQYVSGEVIHMII